MEGVVDRGSLPAPPPHPPGRVATVADAARSLARGMVSGAVRTKTGTPCKPSVVRKCEEQLRMLVVPAVGGMLVGALTRGAQALRVALRVAERDGMPEPGANPRALLPQRDLTLVPGHSGASRGPKRASGVSS